MKRQFLLLWASAALASPVDAQIYVEKVFQVNLAIGDNSQYVDVRTLSDFGMSSILDVNVGVALQSSTGSSMRLGDYFVTLTYGTASEDERVAVLLNRAGATASRPWGSSLSSANLTFDDSVGAASSFSIASTTGTYAADGRLSVNPYTSPVAYSASDATNGLSALNGGILASNTWSLLVADTRQGGVGMLGSWKLGITGTTATSGTINPGAGGSIGDIPGLAETEVMAALQVSGSGVDSVTANVAGNLMLSGGLSGKGNLLKRGNGELVLGGNSSGFTGSLELSQGALRIASSEALGAAAEIRVSGSGRTLNLANSSQLDARILLDGAGAELLLDGAGTLGGALTGAGSLRKVGPGLTYLNGSSELGGGVNVEAGTLSVNGSIAGNGELTVFSGATLKGSGFIHVSTTISGIHAAGNSPGIQTFSSGLTYLAGSVLEWDFINNDLGLNGTDYDQIAVSGGNLTIQDGAVFRLMPGPGVDYSDVAWTVNRSFLAVSFAGGGDATGGFILDASQAGSYESYGTWSTSLVNQGVLVSWNAVPEAASSLLLAFGSTMLLLKRSRRPAASVGASG